MDKTSNTDPGDIVDEAYKGPGAFVTGTGEGAVAHYGFAFGGLLLGGLATYIFHHKAGELVAQARKSAHALSTTSHPGHIGGTKRFLGKCATAVFGHGEGEYKDLRGALTSHELNPDHREAIEKFIANKEHGFGHALLNHTIGLIPAVGRHLKTISERSTNAVAVGGILGFAGFLLSPIYFMFSGAKHANDGKRQFNRAKDEIITTRAERDALLTKYADVKTELDILKSNSDGKSLAVAKDNPPDLDQSRDSIAALSGVNTDSPTGPSAPVIGPAPTTGRTLPGEPPRIKEPVIGPEHAAWSDRMAARAAETATHETVRA